jgi:hypothetical protein
MVELWRREGRCEFKNSEVREELDFLRTLNPFLKTDKTHLKSDDDDCHVCPCKQLELVSEKDQYQTKPRCSCNVR